MVNIKQQIKYWKTSSGRNWKTALGLFELKHYDSCLFFCHLTIEKMLKGLVVRQTKKLAPHIHDLERLAEIAQLNITEEQIKNLKTISRFNMASRYDDVKHNFYKIATTSYTKQYLSISNKIILWLKKQYQKK